MLSSDIVPYPKPGGAGGVGVWELDTTTQWWNSTLTPNPDRGLNRVWPPQPRFNPSNPDLGDKKGLINIKKSDGDYYITMVKCIIPRNPKLDMPARTCVSKISHVSQVQRMRDNSHDSIKFRFSWSPRYIFSHCHTTREAKHRGFVCLTCGRQV